MHNLGHDNTGNPRVHCVRSACCQHFVTRALAALAGLRDGSTGIELMRNSLLEKNMRASGCSAPALRPVRRQLSMTDSMFNQQDVRQSVWPCSRRGALCVRMRCDVLAGRMWGAAFRGAETGPRCRRCEQRQFTHVAGITRHRFGMQVFQVRKTLRPMEVRSVVLQTLLRPR